MGAPPRQQDLNDLKDPSKPILITTTYPYNNTIYPATFSEVLNQNRSDSSSSSRPSYLLTSSVFLCSRSFSGCLNTKEALLHESFHLKPHFQSWFFLAALCWNQLACNLSHLFQDASKISCLPVCPRPQLSLEHPGNRRELWVHIKNNHVGDRGDEFRTHLSQRVIRQTGASG